MPKENLRWIVGSSGALQAYRKALELKRSAAHQEREARRKKLQRARRVRASRFAEAHALENGDAAPLHPEVAIGALVRLLHEGVGVICFNVASLQGFCESTARYDGHEAYMSDVREMVPEV